MNLVDRLFVNYKGCAEIINPFYFEVSEQRESIPIFTYSSLTPTLHVKRERDIVIKLSTNPENISFNSGLLVQLKEIKIFHKDRFFILKEIHSIEQSVNHMTGCIELEIECKSLIMQEAVNE